MRATAANRSAAFCNGITVPAPPRAAPFPMPARRARPTVDGRDTRSEAAVKLPVCATTAKLRSSSEGKGRIKRPFLTNSLSGFGSIVEQCAASVVDVVCLG